MIVNLHIERLVVDGAAADRNALRKAVQAELTRLFSATPAFGDLRTGVAVPVLRGAPLSAQSIADARTFGAGIAQSVHGAISR